jgi:hypothetical protein
VPMRGSSKPEMEDVRSERETPDALTVGTVMAIIIKRTLAAHISFQAIGTYLGFKNHIDDY